MPFYNYKFYLSTVITEMIIRFLENDDKYLKEYNDYSLNFVIIQFNNFENWWILIIIYYEFAKIAIYNMNN